MRVSRSFPFVTKVLDYDMIAAATRVIVGHPIKEPPQILLVGNRDKVGVKVRREFDFTVYTRN